MANIDELYRLCLEDKNGDINRYLGGWDTSSSDSESEIVEDSEDSEDSEDEEKAEKETKDSEEKADESIVAENQEDENQEAENQEAENQVDKLGGDDKPILPPSEEEEMRGAKESLIEKMNKIFKKNRS